MSPAVAGRLGGLYAGVFLLACGKETPVPPHEHEEALFHNVCARCHGQDGTGGPADSLGHPGPRNFTDPKFQDGVTDAQIRSAIENGNRGMPAFGAVFTPEELDLLVAHVRKFDPRAAARVSASSPPAPAKP